MAITTQVSEDGKMLTTGISGRFDISTYKEFGESYKEKMDSIQDTLLI